MADGGSAARWLSPAPEICVARETTATKAILVEVHRPNYGCSPHSQGPAQPQTEVAEVVQPASEIRKIAFVGDYLPRKCGIATFTTDLRCAVAKEFPAMQCLVVPVNDVAGGYDYPLECDSKLRSRTCRPTCARRFPQHHGRGRGLRGA